MKRYLAIGLMSGTSLDGVDAALVETDGHDFANALAFVSLPYEKDFQQSMKAVLGRRVYGPDVLAIEKILTEKHTEAVRAVQSLYPLSLNPSPPPPLKREKGERETELGFGASQSLSAVGEGVEGSSRVDVIGFHGQTLCHDPARRFTFQIGDAALLAKETGIDVVHDFRSADVAAGGQGAPLLPLYHRVLVKSAKLPTPLAVLNIGGVANVTYLNGDDVLAFDTGPGNALINDWVSRHVKAAYDRNGEIASMGTADQTILQKFLAHPYFIKPPPKSLDRDAWNLKPVQGLSLEDGAATLTAFTVASVQKALGWMPARPRRWLVTGGGRHNGFMMRSLTAALGAPVDPVEAVGWNGDALEAEGFAYLAVRSLLGAPLSLPTTTGVNRPLTGGRICKAQI